VKLIGNHDLSGITPSNAPFAARADVAALMKPVVVTGGHTVIAYNGTFPCALWTSPDAAIGDLWVWTGSEHEDGPLFYCGWYVAPGCPLLLAPRLPPRGTCAFGS
jgi:hypothetical protein